MAAATELQSGEEKEAKRTQDQSLQSLGPQMIFYSRNGHTVDGKNPNHRLIGCLSHYL